MLITTVVFGMGQNRIFLVFPMRCGYCKHVTRGSSCVGLSAMPHVYATFYVVEEVIPALFVQ